MGRTGGWQGSTRHDRLPPGWAAKRARIIRRDPRCQLQYPGCTGTSTEVDHRIAGDDHRDTNLQGVCSPCHARKSAGEGTAAHRAKGWATTRRPPEPHPGTYAQATPHRTHTEHAGQARVDASSHKSAGEAGKRQGQAAGTPVPPGGDPLFGGATPG